MLNHQQNPTGGTLSASTEVSGFQGDTVLVKGSLKKVKFHLSPGLFRTFNMVLMSLRISKKGE